MLFLLFKKTLRLLAYNKIETYGITIVLRKQNTGIALSGISKD